uniref:Uncharacterized protein n=1 Tax=mine drainage metagenome TaxID=410659 RepID=E6QIQ7_9ZZZZ
MLVSPGGKFCAARKRITGFLLSSGTWAWFVRKAHAVSGLARPPPFDLAAIFPLKHENKCVYFNMLNLCRILYVRTKCPQPKENPWTQSFPHWNVPIRTLQAAPPALQLRRAMA